MNARVKRLARFLFPVFQHPSTHIGTMPSVLTPLQSQRLREATIIWLASVRPDNSPHLVPIWFVVENERVYICTSAGSIKAKNIAANPGVTIALEDGVTPLVIQASSKILNEFPPSVVDAFLSKYDWDIRTDETYTTVIEISPEKILMG
jgi:hypothetical protein